MAISTDSSPQASSGGSVPMTSDPIVSVAWAELRAAAQAAARHAYAPYSRYSVGAAAATTTRKTITGCNVENASYGLTLCAECGVISALQLADAGSITRFVCVHKDDIIMPCGRCRQLLLEHSAPDATILTPDGERPMTSILPQAFGPQALADTGNGPTQRDAHKNVGDSNE